MKLIVVCPICSQAMTVAGPDSVRTIECPSCQGPIRVRRPPLNEAEILSIVSGKRFAEIDGRRREMGTLR